MAPWRAKPENMSWKPKAVVKIAVTDNDPLNARILKLATDLGNTVLAKKAANDLQALVLPSINKRASHTDKNATVSNIKRHLGLTTRPFSTKSCRYWKHITFAFLPVGLFLTFSINVCCGRSSL